MNKSFSILLFASIFFLLFVGFFHPINSITQDLGRHIKTGEIILQTYAVPKTNFFSYTYPDFPFINHHWLSEVFFFLITQSFGFNGLLILTTTIIISAFLLVFFTSKTKTNTIPLVISSLLYIGILFERTDVRPEMFSFFFLALFVTILYRYKKTSTPFIFLLPVIELLWVNTHIYFPIGIAVIGLFLAEQVCIFFFKGVESTKFSHGANSGNIPQGHKTYTWSKAINYLLSNATRKFSWMNDKLTLLFFIFFASIFTTLLNPNALTGALYPFSVFQNYGYQIEENQNVFFLWNYFGGKTTLLYFFIAVLLLFSSLIFSIKKTQIVDWLLAIFFTAFAFFAERNLPLFVFATFIPFVKSTTYLFETISQKLLTMKQFNNITITSILSIFFLIIICFQVKSIIELKGFGFGVTTGAKNAADFFLANNLKGPIFNNFDIGSYLDYRFYGKEKVFVDGRPESYPATFFKEEYIPMQENKEIFDSLSKKYNLNTIFFAHTDQTPWAQMFLKQIISNNHWQPIYLDDHVIILVKETRQNKTLIQQFGMDTKNLKANNFQPTDFTSLLRLAMFFKTIQSREQEIQTYQQLLAIKPNFCPALGNLTILLNQTNNPAATIYQTRFQQNCQ